MKIRNFYRFLKKNIDVTATTAAIVVLTTVIASATYVIAATDTTNLTQNIGGGGLTVEIVDAAWATVGSPTVAFSAKNFDWACQTGVDSSTGTLGTTTERIYINNPDSADDGWVLTLAAASTTDVWTGSSGSYDYNDPGTIGDGCDDDAVTADADAFGGQMEVDMSTFSATTPAQYNSNITGITWHTTPLKFIEGSVNAITLIEDDGTGTEDAYDLYLKGATLENTIPAEQEAGDYSLGMVLDITAN